MNIKLYNMNELIKFVESSHKTSVDREGVSSQLKYATKVTAVTKAIIKHNLKKYVFTNFIKSFN